MQLYLLFFTALFSVINPLGTVPVFVSLTQRNNPSEIKRIAVFTAINTFIILVVSLFVGNYILTFFGISLESLKIAGGLIIVSSGFALLTGSFASHKGMGKKVKMDAQKRSDISLTPLAIPMLAGPGTISLLITYQNEYPEASDKVILLIALISISVLIFLMLISAQRIVKKLGASGINALSRIIGFLIISIGIEYILSALFVLAQKLTSI